MDRKEHILDSAETLVRTRGFDGFSYADIEKDVGIRKASIHHHYSNKAALSLALVQRYSSRFMDTLTSIRLENTKASDQLSSYLDAYFDALSGGSTTCLCVALSAGRDSLSPPVLKELNQFNNDSIDWLEHLFILANKDGSIINVVDPRMEATATLALAEGAQLIARAAKDTTRFKAAVAGLRARAR